MEPINWFMMVVTQHYFDFNGRARRAEFWWFSLVYFVLYLAVYIFGSILHLGQVLGSLVSLALLLPSLGVGVRRLHDTDKTGWLILIGIIPIVGWIALIYFYVQPGTSGSNQYGPDPKAGLAPSP